MHRRSLISLLEAYTPSDATDAAARDRILRFVRAHDDCFERTLLEGHVTGSAWIVNPARTRCLLTHHRKLDRWLQLGGHADGQTDILEVAMREAVEESGLTSLRPGDWLRFRHPDSAHSDDHPAKSVPVPVFEVPI